LELDWKIGVKLVKLKETQRLGDLCDLKLSDRSDLTSL